MQNSTSTSSSTSSTLPHASIEELTSSRTDGKIHLLLAASGSVATIKCPDIIRALAAHATPTGTRRALSIRLVLTDSAKHFLAGQSAEQPELSSLLALPGLDAVYDDRAEWAESWRRGGAVMHIELRRWADILVVAPLSANTLAKVVGGLCDNLLTSVIRAWDTDGRVDGSRKRILVAPAMNTAMWLHPVTAKQIRVLSEDWGVKENEDGTIRQGWFEVLRPMEKLLACGDVGDGAMKDWREIVEVIESRLGLVP